MTTGFVMFGKTPCPWCDRAKELLREKRIDFKYYDISVGANLEEYKTIFPGKKTVPQIAMITVVGSPYHRYINVIGGYEDLVEYLK